MFLGFDNVENQIAKPFRKSPLVHEMAYICKSTRFRMGYPVQVYTLIALLSDAISYQDFNALCSTRLERAELSIHGKYGALYR
jgi:hypothetical protein